MKNTTRRITPTQSVQVQLSAVAARSYTRQEKVEAAKAWAEFFYDEYIREKSLQRHIDGEIIKEPTYHDKTNAY